MYSFFTRSDLVEVGRTEDGEAVIAEAHYVVAEREDGARFAHEHRFLSVVPAGNDPEYGIPVFRSVDAEAQVAKLLADVESAVDLDSYGINLKYWEAIPAAYGSAAWDEADLIAFERKMEDR